MNLHRTHLRALGHASTIVACPESGDAFVVDPRRDIQLYLDLAAAHGLNIRYVTDTHGHNDYLSGLGELTRTTGATAIAPIGIDAGYQCLTVTDGQQLQLGSVTLEAWHTPGHTPDHTAWLVSSTGSDEPPVLISGGSLLIGDTGRPDLLGGDSEIGEAAVQLAATIRAMFDRLDPATKVLPTHVEGSLCAGAIGPGMETTIGAERTGNPMVRAMLELESPSDSWLERHLLPPTPRYWARMRSANISGVTGTPALVADAPLAARDAEAHQARGAVILDTRSVRRFSKAHIPGSICVPAGDSFATWAGSALPETCDLILVADTAAAASDAVVALHRIGHESILGWMGEEALNAWETEIGSLIPLPELTLGRALQGVAMGQITLIDVRNPLEWQARPVPGAQQVPAATLMMQPDSLPSGPVALLCASDLRSAVAASVLARHGHTEVANVAGGLGAAPPMTSMLAAT